MTTLHCMDIGVLGPVSVDGDTRALSPRDRIVLAALATRADEPVSADELSEALWGGRRPASAHKIVQGCVSRLRKALGSDAITTHPSGYQLAVAGEQLDIRRFERQVRRGEQLLALDEADRAAHMLDGALDLWRGQPLGDLDGWDPARIERERLAELRRDAEELALDARLRAGRHLEALGDARRLVDEAPLRERRWALLARALYQAGRQGDALQTLHRARVMLSTELGLGPGPELNALQEQILRQDDTLAVEPARAQPSTVCPYMGLVPFDVDDADAFFGRSEDVDACLGRLAERGVVVVVGPSGAGKSSLVRAGVAARLRRDGADVVVVTPGARPSDALTALPDGGRAVLVVDQCEEVVALCDDAAERSAFLDAVADHGRRAPVVIALRADRLGDLSEYPAFARLVERGLYLLPPMSGDALRAAIERPAEQAGLLVEPGLVDLLVREVEHEPGALPLLSHALRTTWERREGRTLTVAGYTDAGGIRGAVAQTAEAVWDRVPERRQQVLRDLLLRMVSQADDGAPVRARLSRQVIVDDVGHAELVELLVAERLVTSDGEHLELAHEAVIRAWPRLQAWLTDDAIGQRILRHLSLAADTWEQMGCPDSELYRGVRLAQAVEWRDRAGPHLTPVEASFLDASVALDAAHRRETQQRAARQARVNRRLRLLLAGVGVLSVVALAAGMLAARQAGRAQDAAVAADARRVGAQALAADDIDTALLLAVEGVRLDDSRDTRANLLATLGRSPQLVEAIRGEGQGAFGNVSISPDGATIAVYDDANRLWFYDAGTRAVRATVEFDDSGGTAALVTGGATFHPDDGPVAATSSAIVDRPVKLLDPQTFDELPAQFAGFPGRHLLAWDAVYSPDGRHLAVAFDRYADGGVVQDSQVVVWDLAQPGEPRHVLEVPLFTHGLAFSPDGEQLYTGRHAAPLLADEPSVTVYDVDSGEVGRNMALPSYPLALSPDGTTIAAAAEDGTSGTAVVLADAATGEPVTRLRGHTGTVLDIAFSPDGAQIASSSADRTVILWDTDAAEQRRQFRGHASAVPAVVFDPSSETLISSGADRALLRWDRSGGGQFAPVRTANSAPRAGGSLALSEAWAYVSPDGGRVAYVRAERNPYGSQLTTVQVLDVDSGQLTPAVDTAHGAFLSLSWHPDGDRFATTGGEGIVREWDPRTARIVREGRNALASQGIAYLGAGDDIVVSDPLGAVQLIAGDTLTPGDRPLLVDDFEGEYGLAWAYASSDGRTVALLGRSQLGVDPALASNVFIPEDQLALVDVIDRETAARVELGFDAELAAFSPDGERLAITGRGGQLALVDIAEGTVVRRPPIGHDGNIVSVSFARDGATIATGGQDGRVSLWDGHTGALLSSATVGRPDAAAYAGFRPDGHTVSVANWDGEVYELDTRIERWIEFACEVAGRDLTQAEWRETFRDRPYRATCPGRS